MSAEKKYHILNASVNLLGICFVFITGLKVLSLNDSTILDEITILCVLSLLAAIILSYFSIRSEKHAQLFEKWADYFFLASLGTFSASIIAFSRGLL